MIVSQTTTTAAAAAAAAAATTTTTTTTTTTELLSTTTTATVAAGTATEVGITATAVEAAVLLAVEMNKSDLILGLQIHARSNLMVQFHTYIQLPINV